MKLTLVLSALYTGSVLALPGAASASGSSQCVICDFITTQLNNMLRASPTDDEIKLAVHGVCNYLPKSVANQCNDFIFERADRVIELLIRGQDPETVCAKLGVCAAA